MEPISEKNFTIVDSPEMCTLAFLVNDPEEGTNYCTLKKLDCMYPNTADVSKKVFSLESKFDNEENIVLLTVGGDKAFLNTAILKNNSLMVSKEPTKVGFRVLYDVDSIDEKEIRYTPNFRRPISIIDPEIPDEIRPILYYDEGANMVKAKIQLKPQKSYIALEVKDD